MGGILAIDYGVKKSGFAVADALRISVQPLVTARVAGDSDALLEHIAGLLEERDIGTFLIGMPCHEDGSEGDLAPVIRSFIERLEARFPRVKVATHNEYLTTKEAESQLYQAGYRGKEIKERKDSWSALVLLRDWIETSG